MQRRAGDEKEKPQMRGLSEINSELLEINSKLNRKVKLARLEENAKKTIKKAGYAAALTIIMIILSLLIYQSGITGSFLGEPEYIMYVQNINANITEPTHSTWALDEHPDTFNLRAVSISGQMRGEGTARVYLEGANGRRYTLLDEDAIEEKGLPAVTAYVVNVPNLSEEQETEELPDITEPAASEEEEDARTITTSLEYADGELWDIDNDGVAYIEDGVVDFTVSGSAFSWTPDESKLCTRWIITSLDTAVSTTVCNGAADCCALVDVAPTEDKWDAPLYLFHGKNGATEENRITAQVVFIDQNIGDETYFESAVGTTSSLPARFIEKPVVAFSDICVETCTLPDGLNATEYTLVFELGYGVELVVENITYALQEEVISADQANATEANITVEVVPEIKDSKGNRLAATVEFIDSRGEVKSRKAMAAAHHGAPGAMDAENRANLQKGSYKVRIDMTASGGPVKRIEIDDVSLDANTTDFLRFEDVEETGDLATYSQVYAIDPTAVNFTNATVTVTATGSELYKCANWSFESQECLDGNWVFLQSITPGQEYNFTLTPTDPGLAEGSGTFFEGFESGNLDTNNWTNSGTGNNWFIGSSYCAAGAYCAWGTPAGGTKYLETNINTRGYVSIQFSFYASTWGLDSGEYFSASWYNGSVWTEVLNIQNIWPMTLYSYSLPAQASNNNQFRIRFGCSASNANEECYLDNVQVSGTLDTTPPASVTNLAEQSTGYTWIYWNWTNPSDSDFDHTEVWINGTFYANVSKPTKYYNATGLSEGVTYQIQTRTSDINNNVNPSWVNDLAATTISDSAPPTWSSNKTIPASGTAHVDGADYQFNVTWNDTTGIHTVLMEHNFTGTLQNYSISGNNSDEYYYDYNNLSVGSYVWRMHANDTYAGYANQTTQWVYTVTDTTPPGTVSGISESATGKTWIMWNWTNPADADFDSAILYLNGTNIANTSNEYYNSTGLSGYTSYRLTVHTKDIYGNVNDTDVYDNAMTQDSMAPQYSAIIDQNNSVYTPGADYQFNITWQDNVAVEEAYMIFDGTNYTSPGNDGDVYYVTISDLSAGSHSYEWYANDFLENINSTGIRTFTVQKSQSNASALLSLMLNGTASNITIERTSHANLTATRLSGTENISLYRNGSPLGTGTLIEDISQYDSETTYNITAVYPETQNYTSARTTYWLTVDDTTPPDDVSGVMMLNRGLNYIYWVWTNPAESDFAYTEVRLNNSFKTNTTNTYYYATGLNHSTDYTISLRTFDVYGNAGSWTNDTRTTLYNCTENWVSYFGACRSNDTRLKLYNDTNNCGTNYTIPGDYGTEVSCDYIISTKFNGTTTNFVSNDLSNLQGVVLEIWPRGTIEFKQNISINRSLDLNTYADIGQRHAYINSAQLPEFNRSANITIYGINFTSPRIMADGAVCNSSVCGIVNYSGGVLVFNVTHFTNYSIEESPYCGDSSCNGGESCSSCALDCGVCGAGGGGAGGGGGGGGAPRTTGPCEPNWLCYSWGPCDSNQQSRACFDANACNNLTDKPVTERYCVAGCAERWACGDWGKCTEAGVQTRTCNDLAKCGTESRKPETVQPCEYDFCSDGKQNNNETGTDCGGNCRQCTEEELEEAAHGRRDLLTGEAITVAPYEPPNPVYIMPLLLMLVLLIAVIALHKTNLSDRMKKIVTAAHTLLIIAIFIMLLLTFNVPEITGEAVNDMIGTSGASGMVLAVIVSALLLGGVTYVTINKGLPGLPGLEQYYARSKYWTAYAVQKVKWSAKRKKMREELKLDISKETPAHPAPSYPAQTAKVRPAEDAIGEERMLFGEVMKAVEKLNIKVGEIEDKVDEIKVSEKIDKPAKTVIQQKTEQAKTKPKPEPLKIQPAKTLPAKTVLKNTQPAKALPAKKEPAKTAPASAQPAKRPDPRTLSGRFGTEDPLKIAESILKRKRDEDDE